MQGVLTPEIHGDHACERVPRLRVGALFRVRMRRVAEPDRDGVSDEGQDRLGVADGKVEPEPLVEREVHDPAVRRRRLEEGHREAVDDDGVVLERSDVGDAGLRRGEVVRKHSVTAVHIAFFNYFDPLPWMARLNGVRDIIYHERNPGILRAKSWKMQLIRFRTRLASWPMTLRLTMPPIGDVLFCHATPRNENEIFTRLTAEDRLIPIFEPANAAVVVCGHTHMPFDRQVGRTRVINAGSVGMPFGPAGADWLVLGPDAEPRHTSYDAVAAAARIRASGYPGAEEFVTRYVLNQPSAADMLKLYADHELKS